MTGQVITHLKKSLADSYVLFVKTQNYHWNVTGPNFASLHALFEEQYNDLFAANDELAERIRALGAKAPGKLVTYADLASIIEGDENLDAAAMVQDLANDQDKIIVTLNATLKAAQDAADEVTVGIITDRLTVHEKNAWMLKSSL